MYQKYANANRFSDWMKDLMRFALEPLETGTLQLPEEPEEEE